MVAGDGRQGFTGITDSYNGTLDVKPATASVREFRLDKNYPNPFNPATEIRFHVRRQAG